MDIYRRHPTCICIPPVSIGSFFTDTMQPRRQRFGGVECGQFSVYDDEYLVGQILEVIPMDTKSLQVTVYFSRVGCINGLDVGR